MINYTISEFLGIFLVGFPILVFATTILLWGLRQLINYFFEDDKTIFHHHYHYKDKTYAPPRKRSGENL